MKADVGPDRVSPLSNSRSYSSKRRATHSSQGEDDRLRDLKIFCSFLCRVGGWCAHD